VHALPSRRSAHSLNSTASDFCQPAQVGAHPARSCQKSSNLKFHQSTPNLIAEDSSRDPFRTLDIVSTEKEKISLSKMMKPADTIPFVKVVGVDSVILQTAANSVQVSQKRKNTLSAI